MSRGLCERRALRESGAGSPVSPRLPSGGCVTKPRRLFMVWQTPAATDIRFGFEITLYVAAR
ncbi:MAG: pyrroloquinoline quinone precursor peptide PqqA [Burkholderiaceae bacterium]|nr:pyrroloquinoline quinone precursor peptide PqqA [Burkholderiaceae bacterium]